MAVFEAEDLLVAGDDLSDVLVTHRVHASEQSKSVMIMGCPKSTETFRLNLF